MKLKVLFYVKVLFIWRWFIIFCCDGGHSELLLFLKIELNIYYLEIWPQQNVLFATIKWLHRQARRKKMLQYFVRNSWHFTFSFTTHKRAHFELHNSLANFSLWLSHALFQVESYHLGHQTTTDIDLQIVCNEPKTQR